MILLVSFLYHFKSTHFKQCDIYMKQLINEYESNTLPIWGHTNTLTTYSLADSKGKNKNEHIPTTRQISHCYSGLGKRLN